MERFKGTYQKDGFVEDKFVDGFDEELIYEYLAERFKDDPLIHVLSRDTVPEGFSRIGLLDMDAEKITVSSDRIGIPKYEVKPDYFPIETMFENFDRFYEGDESPYKYVPVAVPVVPTNKLFDCDESKMIDGLMIERGFKILDPTPGQSAMCDESNSVIYSDDLKGKYFDRFALRTKSRAAIKNDCTVVSLEFNPFNPRSATLIQQLTWVSETRVVGTYKYREKIYSFSYDLNSTYFRYHPDIWMKKVGMDCSVQYHYQCFDMVSVKRFLEEGLVPRDYGASRHVGGIFVEPFSTDRKPVLNYSIIGPWKGIIERGMRNDRFYVPYLTPQVEMDLREKHQLDAEVRKRREDEKDEKDRQPVPCRTFSVVYDHKVTKDQVIDKERGIRIKYHKRKLYSNDYFIRFTDSTSVLLRRDKEGDRYMYECNFRIPSEFCNYHGSIIEHPKTVSLINYITDRNQQIKDQRMASEDWSDMVDESFYNLKMQDVTDLSKIMEEPILKLDYVKFNGGTSSRVEYRQINYHVKEKLDKDRDEKLQAAIQDHRVGPEYKQNKFYRKYFSQEKHEAKRQFIEDSIKVLESKES